MPPLQAELDLAIEQALDSVNEIDSALDQSASNFSAALTQALTDAAATPLELDISAAEAQLAALSGEQVDVPVDAETAEAEAEIAAVGDSVESIEVPVEAPGAEEAAEQVASVGEAGDAAAGGLDQATGASAAFSGASAIATGNAGALGGAVGGLAGEAGVAAAGALTLAAGVGILFNQALSAAAAEERFNRLTGEMGSEISQVNVGSLNTDLRDLAITLGSDDEALLEASASLFTFAKNAGLADAPAAEFTETVAALAARAVALNPSLGQVSDVIPLMSRGLATGGRFAQRFGIELSRADIAARAAENAARGLGDGVSVTSLQLAGAQLASEKYGDSLQEDIAKGAENPIIQQRRLREEINNLIEAAGQPIVMPILELMEESQPAVGAFATALGELTAAALPSLIQLLEASVGPLELAAGLISALPGPVTAAAAAGALFAARWGLIPGVLAATVPLLQGISPSLGGAAASAGLFAVAGAQLGTRLNAIGPGAGAAAGALAGLGLQSGNTIGSVLGLASAGAVLGSTIAPGLGTAIGAGAGALIGFGASLLGASDDAEDAKTKIQQLAQEIEGLGDKRAAGAFIESLGAAGIESSIDAIRDKLRQLAEESPGAAQAVLDGLLKMGGGTDVVFAAVTQAAEGQGVLFDAVQAGTEAYTKNAQGAQDIAAANEAAAGATSTLSSAAITASQALSESAEAAEQYKTILDSLLGIHLSSLDAQLAYRDSMIGIAQAASEATDKSSLFSDENIGLASDLSGATQKVHDFAEAIIRENGPDALPFATQLLRDHRQGLIDTLGQYGFAPPVIDEFLNRIGLTAALVDPATGALAGLVTEGLAPLGPAATAASEAYAEGLAPIPDATILAMLAAGTAVTANTPQLAAAAAEAGQQAFINTGNGFAQIPLNVAQTMIAAGQEVVFATPAVAGAAGTGAEEMASRWEGGVGVIPGVTGGAVGAAGGAIPEAASSVGIIAYSQGSSVGSQFGRGMFDGISNWKSSIVAKAEEIARAAANAAEDELGIESPSRVTRHIGEQFGAGFAGGIAASQTLVLRETRQTARAAAAALSPAGGAGAGSGAPQRNYNFYGPVSDPASTRRIFDELADEADLELDMAIRRNQE